MSAFREGLEVAENINDLEANNASIVMKKLMTIIDANLELVEESVILIVGRDGKATLAGPPDPDKMIEALTKSLEIVSGKTVVLLETVSDRMN